MRRLLSLWLPRFAIECQRRAKSAAAAEAPFALLRAEQGRLILAAVCERAAGEGLHPGQPLAAARVLVPELALEPERPAAARGLLRRLARRSERYTPWVAEDPSAALLCGGLGGDAGLFLDITGCAHLFGGEAALAKDLLDRLARAGHLARLGIAATPGAAWALARQATAPNRPLALLPAESDLKAGLAPLPVAGLRLPAAVLELLDRLGLQRIGQLYALPPATLTPRFGQVLNQRLAEALGRRAEPIAPLTPVAELAVRRHFAEPVAEPADLDRVLALLFAELAETLGRQGLGARRLVVTGHRADGGRSSFSLGLSRPSRDPHHFARLARPAQERLDPGFGFDLMSLAAPVVEPLEPEQAALSGGDLLAAARPEAALAALVDRLEERLGQGSVTRPAALPSHWPERASALRPPFAPLAERPQGLRARPLHLLRRPEPVEVMALLPDRPPARFTWRRRSFQLARAEGPERLEPGWWRPEEESETARDYWRVEDQDGRRFWLYRRIDSGAPRWFLHGLFA